MFVTLVPWRQGLGLPGAFWPFGLAELVSFSPVRDPAAHKTRGSLRTTLKVVF